MAGSDFYNRTRRDQAALPVETAGPQTLVQMAIVYQGNEIRVYRNGKFYSAHRISGPQTFKQDAMVLVGLRYVGKIGKHGFFDEAIEEARIYNVALDEATIAALEPGKPSDPKPLAQWTFEDGIVPSHLGQKPKCATCSSPCHHQIKRKRIFFDKFEIRGVHGFPVSDDPDLLVKGIPFRIP